MNPVLANCELAGAWCSDRPSVSPWIQVDFNATVTITGVITQGRAETEKRHYVTKYQVAYSDGQSWNNLTDANGTAITFTGNERQHSHVTAHFPMALRTRILRILAIEWYTNCCMRFELLGCY
ncbi:lactadherin-like [Patiria miniata]|uniref:F5/8 type C domain-containing protein n=1 Tax=Patiria miniata TaxID=46514 RepID=A0A914AST2_PATMI|nr:lactadherin-like [Patiria miniata]